MSDGVGEIASVGVVLATTVGVTEVVLTNSEAEGIVSSVLAAESDD